MSAETKGSNISAYFGCVFGLLQMSMSVVGCMALWRQVSEWSGFPWILVIPILLIVLFIPFLGNYLGMMGAINYWHWQTKWAILFFWGHPILMIILLIGFLITAGIQRVAEWWRYRV
jgi:hypothetical protein